MTNCQCLQIEGNAIKDEHGLLLARIPTELGLNKVRSYAHIFVVAFDLLDCLQNKVNSIVENDAFKQDMTVIGSGFMPYVGSIMATRVPSIAPRWLPRAIQTIGQALGSEDARFDCPMDVIDVRPLWIDDRSLKDDDGVVAAVISDQLPYDDARSYAHLFVASVDLLDILDAMSRDELAVLRRDYTDALAFNKKNNVVIATSEFADQFVTPPELEQMLQLTAKAKNLVYKTPTMKTGI
jgi:hypothetical protein